MNDRDLPRASRRPRPDEAARSWTGRAGIRLCLLLAVAGCVGTQLELREPATANGFCLNGRFVISLEPTLHESLEHRIGQRNPSWFAPGNRGPLVLVDGRPVAGLEQLARLAPARIASVETLEPFRAVPEYGTRGREGAVIVVTKSGLAAGVDRPPDARPVTPCRGTVP